MGWCMVSLASRFLMYVLVVAGLASCGTGPSQADVGSQSTDGLGTQDSLVEVSLRVHAWSGYAEPLVDDFRDLMRKRGFEVNLDLQAATGLEGFTTALRDNQADIISPAHDLTRTFIQQNLVQELDPELLPVSRQVNPLIFERLALSPDVLPYIAPLTFGPYALAYRTDAFEKPPTSYRALWDAGRRGRVSIADYDTANIYMAALMIGIPKTDLFSMNADQLAQVEDALRALHENTEPKYWGDNLPVEEAHVLDVGTDWGVGVQQINASGNTEWAITVPEKPRHGLIHGCYQRTVRVTRVRWHTLLLSLVYRLKRRRGLHAQLVTV